MTFIVLGWTVWCVQILEAVLRGFGGFRGGLGWDLVFHKKEFKAAGREPAPAQMLPATVIAFDGLFASTAATLLGVALLAHWLNPTVIIDPLCATNVTYSFGHDIANFIIYMLVALVYVGLPRYTHRMWENSRVGGIGSRRRRRRVRPELRRLPPGGGRRRPGLVPAVGWPPAPTPRR